MFCVGAVQLNVAVPVVAALTTIEKAGREALAVPSETEMVMFEKVPAEVGAPVKLPVAVLKVAHEGLLLIE